MPRFPATLERPIDASPATDPLLSAIDLHTHFAVKRAWFDRTGAVNRAVDGVSFDIHPGRTLGLVGESGCGKTTLGRTILRLTPAHSGRAVFDGVDVLAASGPSLRRLRRKIQVIFQDPFGSLNPRMRVGAIVAEPLVVHGIGTKRDRCIKVEALLDRVGLRAADARRYPHEFSGGQRQRIAVARALAPEPKLIICDEPVSALDVSVQAQIINLLRDLQEALGVSYLFIAHNLAVVRHISHRVAVMYLGRIVETADVDELYRHPRHPYTMALLESVLEPDPSHDATPRVLDGEPPSPVDPPSGCAFHPRCPHATDQCRAVAPTLQPISTRPADHLAACHHAETLEWDGGSPTSVTP